MKKNKILIIVLAFSGLIVSCKKQLDVKNPNLPTPESAKNEPGIIALAEGSVYFGGLGAGSLKYGGFNGSFWNDPVSYHDLMGDEIGVEAANQFINQFTCPDYIILDDGSKVLNPQSPSQQIPLLRSINTNANLDNNPFYYEWGYMYTLITGCNRILGLVDEITFSGDGETRKNTIKAWAYWWKGYAYSRIGSFYYAGLITDNYYPAGATNSNYVTKEAIITEANTNFDKCSVALTAASSGDDYFTVISKLIPDFFQIGKGGVPSVDMWKRNINTMKARNLLVNTPSATMTMAQWNEIITLTTDGIKADDNVFTGRSNTNSDFMGTYGCTAPLTVGSEPGYRVSERLVNDFRAGDKRFTNNFELKLDEDGNPAPWIGNADRGIIFNTRYDVVDGGKGMPGVVVFGTTETGAYELYIAGTYEENTIMLAEAKIHTGDVAGGLALIDEVRASQGAGLPAISGTITNPVLAEKELRSERRICLVFRGMSFYDARRWGVIDPVANGGGAKNVTVLDQDGNLNTKVTIEFNYLDYWDVPDNELVYNPPASGSAPVKNPK
jgi:starch-binding outer membrane protein, SusD/RagB family